MENETALLDTGRVQLELAPYMRVQDLRTHPEPYVTVAELAKYWLVGRKYIYKLIGTGRLAAIRLGPRALRVRTIDAIRFERRSSTPSSRRTRSKSAVRVSR